MLDLNQPPISIITSVEFWHHRCLHHHERRHASKNR